jgi:tetratricopeptide (TPR) repeat protein
MKKLLLTLLFVSAVAAYAQQTAPPSAPAGSSAQPAPAAGPKQQQKTIKDPAEYKAYVDAVQASDPAQKATLLESFLKTYPSTVMKEDATELLLKTYQQLLATDPQKYTQKVLDTGQQLLQINPNNLTALALLSYMDHALAQGGGPNAEQMLKQAGQYGERGMQQLQTQSKPEGYTDDQWNKLKQDFRIVFLGSIGHAALQAKDYKKAQDSLKEVVAADPNNFTNVFLLALAYLEPNPPVPEGLFWIARAIALAPPQMPATQLQTYQRYGRGKYIRYHGSEDGWDQLLAMAKTAPAPPANFSVVPAPSPSEQAGMMLQKSTPEQLSFADWQFILTSGNQQAADQVWNAIKGKALRMVAQVVSATTTSVQIAASEDDIQANKADVELTFATPLTAARVPKPGAQITIQGVPDSYTPNPFLMRMKDGQLISPPRQPSTPRRRPAQ